MSQDDGDSENKNQESAQSRAKEMQRNIEFIIRKQAQFASDMQSLRAAQGRSEERWERTEEGIRSLLAIAEIHEREIGTLAEGQSRLAEAQARLSEAQDRTDAQMKETGDRLNALINVVERTISERRNGGRGQES